MRNLHRRFNRYYIGQIYGGDFAKICGLLRIYELYKQESPDNTDFGESKIPYKVKPCTLGTILVLKVGIEKLTFTKSTFWADRKIYLDLGFEFWL